MEGQTLGKGNFARVELATHGVTRCKVGSHVDIVLFLLRGLELYCHRQFSPAAQMLWGQYIETKEKVSFT